MTTEQVGVALKSPLLTCDEARQPYLSAGKEVPIQISFACNTDGVEAVDKEWARHEEIRFARDLTLFEEKILVTFEFFDGALVDVQVDFDFAGYQAPQKRLAGVAAKLRERFEKSMGVPTVEPSDTIDGGFSVEFGDVRRKATVWVNPSHSILNFSIWDSAAREAHKRLKSQRDDSAIQ